MESVAIKSMSNEFSAAGPALGYYYQLRCALLFLIKSPKDSEMSLETLDDVVFEKNGRPEELVQTKHKINSTASLIDTSSDIWKSLRIWSTEISRGNFNTEEVKLTFITTATAREGSAASNLGPIEFGKRKPNEALQTFRKIASEDKGKVNEDAYKAFLEIGDEKQEQLVNNITIIDAFPSINDLKDRIETELKLVVPDKFKIPLLKRLEGWWFDRSIKQLSGETKGVISFKELHDEIWDLQKQFEDDNLPIDFLETIAPHESQLPPEQRIFIEQLKWISIGNPRIKIAISDYYRAYEQRSRWVREDLLLVGELSKYEKKLFREWHELFEIMKEELGNTPNTSSMESKGRELYNTVILKLNVPIRPRVTEPYVMRGSYHMLANKREVGWHLKFVERLQELLQPVGRT